MDKKLSWGKLAVFRYIYGEEIILLVGFVCRSKSFSLVLGNAFRITAFNFLK
ncbi:hypothetical protein [Leptospira interrogans]|uniref:hypothetical protein n=1 Tax=Leptospira interrogans TaxID=173 RepID=UPI0018A20CD6|nr:hypothetical protein [Leptospira interrogans]